MLRPQVRGRLFRNGGSCAIGAAMEATGSEYNEELVMVDATKRFPILFNGSNVDYVGRRIWKKNDLDNLTREAIADWLQPIEEAWWAAREQQPEAEEVATEVSSISELMTGVR